MKSMKIPKVDVKFKVCARLTITGMLIDVTRIEGNDTIKARMPGDINMDGKVDINARANVNLK